MRPGTETAEDRERLAARISVSMSAIEAFCDRWRVEELALFGSVLRDDFGPDSDIDVLVRFSKERTPGLFGIVGMERELAELLDRRVDLVTRSAVDASRNYIRRKAILESARVLYAREAPGRGRTRFVPALTPLSEAARTARKPLPPHELYDAKSDRVHEETGRGRAARTARGPRRRRG